LKSGKEFILHDDLLRLNWYRRKRYNVFEILSLNTKNYFEDASVIHKSFSGFTLSHSKYSLWSILQEG
jgi:hypothetical protein